MNIRAAITCACGRRNVALTCALDQPSTDKPLPLAIPLSIVQLTGCTGIETLLLQPSCDGQPAFAAAKAGQLPLGVGGLLHDVHLAACPAIDSAHAAFKVFRSAGTSCALSVVTSRTGVWGQDPTPLFLGKQVLAQGGDALSIDTPVQMSGELPEPLLPGAAIEFHMGIQATTGSAVACTQRAEGCMLAHLPAGTTNGPSEQSRHYISLGKASAVVP